MSTHIRIPVLFQTEQALIEQQEMYKRWEMADPSAEDLREDELWYTFPDQVQVVEVRWPRDCIGHYHEAEGDNTRIFHKFYDVSYIAALTIQEFEQLINP